MMARKNKELEEGLNAFLKLKRDLDAKAETGPFGYHEEFNTLRQRTLSYRDDKVYESQEGEKAHNFRKNRYKDILPYDYTRFKLDKISDMPGTDYINANYIKIPQDDMKFIAAQGPLPNTVRDFWRMIWENETNVILMACSEYEGDPPKHKCERYWPKTEEEEMRFDQISVRLEREVDTEYSDYKIRVLRAEKDSTVRRIHQLHYVGWPDHGVPTCVTPILDMVVKARSYQPDESPPYVVHCSAGCGRTGTIIAVEIAWNMLKNGRITPDFDLFSVVDEMRKQRPSLVQSLDQYKFVYEAVAEIFARRLDRITKHAYENVSLVIPAGASSKEKPETSPSVKENKPGTSPGNQQPGHKPLIKTNSSTLPRVRPKPSAPPKPRKPSSTVPIIRASFEQNIRHHEELDSDPSTHSTLSPATDLPNVSPKEDFDSYSLATADEGGTTLTLSGVCTTQSHLTNEEPQDEEPSQLQKSQEFEQGNEYNQYAYANPYSQDKWSLQHIALGKSAIGEDITYSQISEKAPPVRTRPSQIRKVTPQYEEVDPVRPMVPIPPVPVHTNKPSPSKHAKEYNPYSELDEETGECEWSDDEVAPVIPDKLPGLSVTDTQNSKVEAVTKKGKNISFPHRVGRPRGPRPMMLT